MKLCLLSLLPLLAAAAPSMPSTAGVPISVPSGKRIPNSYIVIFKKGVTVQSAGAHQSWLESVHSNSQNTRIELRKRSGLSDLWEPLAGLKHTFAIGNGLLGYAGHFDDETIEQVRRHKDVELVEYDSVVHALEEQVEVERNAPWGLARISHRETLDFSTFNKYLYTKEAGKGVDVYIVDTGTRVDHVDFEGRAKWAATIPQGDPDEDGNGHGTHCSGTAVGAKYGVAKKADLYAVKVLRSNGAGSMSDVVKGVDFVAQRHAETVKEAAAGKRKGFKGSVANMSLGGGKSTALDRAVDAAVAHGVHFSVAAGNDNADACNYSPAAASRPITVAASAVDDSRAYFSNYGKCVDIFAPGLNIMSTWKDNKYATKTISGTSMAAPHVAGLLAYYLSLAPESDSQYSVGALTPEKLKKHMIAVGSMDTITDPGRGSPNVLAWNGGGSSSLEEIIGEGSYTPKAGSKSAGPKKAAVPSKLADVSAEVAAQLEKMSETIAESVYEKISKAFQS